MAWNYTPGDPSPTNQVRFYIGDTVSTDPQLQDEEIAFLVTQEALPIRAAILACRRLAARYARMTYTVGDGLAKQYQVLQQHYLSLAAALRLENAQNNSPIPYAGGLSIAEKQSWQNTTDLVQPVFMREAMNEPGTEPEDPPETFLEVV